MLLCLNLPKSELEAKEGRETTSTATSGSLCGGEVPEASTEVSGTPPLPPITFSSLGIFAAGSGSKEGRFRLRIFALREGERKAGIRTISHTYNL